MIYKSCISILLLLPFSSVAQEDTAPSATTTSGEVIGAWTQTWGGNKLASFTSIPYAKPPIGSLRFMPPVPVDPWTEPLQATGFRGLCSQDDTGEEDCLFLDVHSPENASGLPVMFYIHGGGLRTGSRQSHFDPVFLGDYGVILVSVNYRLGLWGFLSAADSEFTGNQGFRDQALALTWFRDNAAAFGGDPDKITIFGESAGSWSVSHQVLSPLVSGLFRAAIGHSGTPIGHLNFLYRTEEQDLERGQRVVEAVACEDEESVTQCMQAAPQELLQQISFTPRGVVDGSMSDDPYLPNPPEEALAAGDFNQVPVIFGANSGEALLFMQAYLENPALIDVLNNDWDELYGPLYLFERENNGDITETDVEISAAAREFFFENGIIDINGLDRLVLIVTDAMFQYGVHVWMDYLSTYVPTYQYMLTYEGSLSFLNKTQLDTYGFDLGVAHVDDLQFVFTDSEPEEYSDWTEQDDLVKRRMCEMWTNFAKYLDPTPPHVPASGDLGDFEWRQVDEDGGHEYLNIGSSLEMDASQDYQDRMAFWKDQVGI